MINYEPVCPYVDLDRCGLIDELTGQVDCHLKRIKELENIIAPIEGDYYANDWDEVHRRWAALEQSE
jgi:hypothetical protein